MLSIFTCCFHRKRSHKLAQPDERSYLIPTEPQIATVDDEATRRQRALQTKLTGIVRAKEGKMVNLHARLPFNLHNKNLSARLDPSSSRSASDSVLASPTSPRFPITYSQTHYASPLAGDSRHPSESRSTSVATGQEDGDIISDRPLILNLRLVNPILNKPISRGRSPTKYSSSAGMNGGTYLDDRDEPSILQSASPPSETENVTSPASTVTPAVTISGGVSHNLSQPSLSVSPASMTSFRIQETTPLILEWGP